MRRIILLMPEPQYAASFCSCRNRNASHHFAHAGTAMRRIILLMPEPQYAASFCSCRNHNEPHHFAHAGTVP
jgi:NADH:ubiquinone oxidoreductase subunit B-like Fe-S oxidoreductase